MSLAFLLVHVVLAFNFVVVQPIELLPGVILLGLLALEGRALFETLRQQGRLLLQIEALEAGLAAHGTLPVNDHEEEALQDFAGGQEKSE